MSKHLGQMGELSAAEFLTRRGYKILIKNFRSRFGEIDIIASFNGALVFVEVKTRSHERFGTPAEAITRQKMNKLRRLIGHFTSRYNVQGPIRFEVVAISQHDSPQLITDIEFVDN